MKPVQEMSDMLVDKVCLLKAVRMAYLALLSPSG